MSRIAAIILAAGSSHRFGTDNKLLQDLGGKPIVAHVAEAACSVEAFDTVYAVTGNDRERVERALGRHRVYVVYNPDFATGMASSLKTGIDAARHAGATHAMVFLGDMPLIRADALNTLIDVSARNPAAAIRAVHGGNPGNPVILPAAVFDSVSALNGDEGARALFADGCVAVIDVELDRSVTTDVDTPEALEALRTRS